MLKIKLLYLTCILIFCITLAGCSKVSNVFGITSVAGYCISEDTLSKITMGINQKEVFNLLGSPSFTSLFDKGVWYYVYQKTWYIAVFKEKLVNQRILILQFNNEGNLINIQHKDMKDTKNFKFDNTSTKFIYKKNTLQPDLFQCID